MFFCLCGYLCIYLTFFLHFAVFVYVCRILFFFFCLCGIFIYMDTCESKTLSVCLFYSLPYFHKTGSFPNPHPINQKLTVFAQ